MASSFPLVLVLFSYCLRCIQCEVTSDETDDINFDVPINLRVDGSRKVQRLPVSEKHNPGEWNDGVLFNRKDDFNSTELDDSKVASSHFFAQFCPLQFRVTGVCSRRCIVRGLCPMQFGYERSDFVKQYAMNPALRSSFYLSDNGVVNKAIGKIVKRLLKNVPYIEPASPGDEASILRQLQSQYRRSVDAAVDKYDSTSFAAADIELARWTDFDDTKYYVKSYEMRLPPTFDSDSDAVSSRQASISRKSTTSATSLLFLFNCIAVFVIII